MGKKMILGIVIGSILWICKMFFLPMLQGMMGFSDMGMFMISRMQSQMINLLLCWIVGVSVVFIVAKARRLHK